MASIDWSVQTIAGYGPPVFKHWFTHIIQESITLPQPAGVTPLKFIPHEIVFRDINQDEKAIHFGWDVEFTFKYTYITSTDMKKLIKVYSWRSNEIDGTRIQCFPHSDSKFNFFGRFTTQLDFGYPREMYRGHQCQVTFRSTSRIQDIPRITANRILRKLVV